MAAPLNTRTTIEQRGVFCGQKTWKDIHKEMLPIVRRINYASKILYENSVKKVVKI
jgi:hypothetical protein